MSKDKCVVYNRDLAFQLQLRCLLIPEKTGGYTTIAIRLPGCASRGDTEEEAIENIKEAFQGVAPIYLKDGGHIPWTSLDCIEAPPGSIEKWLLVEVCCE